ncbi:hypothetical protein Scep_008919 [Stephania cephalantha]|uniref:DUF3511 domain-containing protein n=1 Tax=Stephania cephalantha TaxID=152367 RepID=A0AAP0PC25_9MAGN
MVDFRSGFYPPEPKRRIEVVSGKDFSANQTYTMMVNNNNNNNQHRSSSPDDHDHRVAPAVPVSFTTSSHRRTPKRRSGLAGSNKSSWRLSDPEMKRRRRVIKYKLYAVEGKVKDSFRRGFRWIKNKCSEIVHGF